MEYAEYLVLFWKWGISVILTWIYIEIRFAIADIMYLRVQRFLIKINKLILHFIIFRSMAAVIEMFVRWKYAWLSLIVNFAFFASVGILVRVRRKRAVAEWNTMPTEAEYAYKKGFETIQEIAAEVVKR